MPTMLLMPTRMPTPMPLPLPTPLPTPYCQHRPYCQIQCQLKLYWQCPLRDVNAGSPDSPQAPRAEVNLDSTSGDEELRVEEDDDVAPMREATVEARGEGTDARLEAEPAIRQTPNEETGIN